MDKYLSVLDKREQRLLKLLAQEMTIAEMVEASPIYGGHYTRPELTRYWEGRMIVDHLDLLLAKGHIQATAKGYRSTAGFVMSP